MLALHRFRQQPLLNTADSVGCPRARAPAATLNLLRRALMWRT